MFKPDSEVKGYNTKDKAGASAKENWLVLQIRKEILRKRPQFGITFLHLLFLLENVNKFYNNQPFFVTECLLSENDLMFLNVFWVKDKALKHLSKFIGWVNKRFCIQIDVILFFGAEIPFIRVFTYALWSFYFKRCSKICAWWEANDAYRKIIAESFTESFTNWSSRPVKVWKNYPWHSHLQRSREFLQTLMSYMFYLHLQTEVIVIN